MPWAALRCVGRQDGAADRAGDAVEGDRELGSFRGAHCLRGGVAVDAARQARAHVDQLVQDGAVILGVVGGLVGERAGRSWE